MLIQANWNFLFSGETGGPWNFSPSFDFTLIICGCGSGCHFGLLCFYRAYCRGSGQTYNFTNNLRNQLLTFVQPSAQTCSILKSEGWDSGHPGGVLP